MTKKCVGLLVRQGFGGASGLSSLSSAYQAVLGGAVVNGGGQNGEVLWNTLQASAGSPPGTGTISNAAIDSAFKAVKSYNATNPQIPWSVKLRVDAGVYMPAWLLALAGTNYPGTSNSFGPILTNSAGQHMLQFWTAAYRQVWQNFMATVAAYVPTDGLGYTLDTHPYLGEFGFGGAMLTYAEPMLPTGWTPYTYLGFASEAAYAAVAQPALRTLMADTIAAWPNTPVGLSYNPYCNTSDAWTETTMAWQVKATNAGGGGGVSPMGVLMNNSLRNPPSTAHVVAPARNLDPNTGAAWCTYGATYTDHLGPSAAYTAMYAAMAKLGPGAAAAALGGSNYPIANPSPICFQTAQLTLIEAGDTGTNATNDLCNTLSYAVWLGARSVELPTGFNTVMTPAQLGAYNNGLFANDPAGGGPPPTPIVQDVQGATSAAATTLVVGNALTTAGNGCVLIVGARASATPTISVSGGGTWANRINQNTASANGNLTVWDLIPGSPIAANGITITSSHSGSIEYQFYEVFGQTNYETSAVAATGTTSTAPTASATPANSSDLVFGAIFLPASGVAISALPGWTNDAPITGGA
jgi:hypothetical protein